LGFLEYILIELLEEECLELAKQFRFKLTKLDEDIAMEFLRNLRQKRNTQVVYADCTPNADPFHYFDYDTNYSQEPTVDSQTTNSTAPVSSNEEIGNIVNEPETLQSELNPVPVPEPEPEPQPLEPDPEVNTSVDSLIDEEVNVGPELETDLLSDLGLDSVPSSVHETEPESFSEETADDAEDIVNCNNESPPDPEPESYISPW